MSGHRPFSDLQGNLCRFSGPLLLTPRVGPKNGQHAAMGQARHPAIISQGSAQHVGLSLWRDLPY